MERTSKPIEVLGCFDPRAYNKGWRGEMTISLLVTGAKIVRQVKSFSGYDPCWFLFFRFLFFLFLQVSRKDWFCETSSRFSMESSVCDILFSLIHVLHTKIYFWAFRAISFFNSTSAKFLVFDKITYLKALFKNFVFTCHRFKLLFYIFALLRNDGGSKNGSMW